MDVQNNRTYLTAGVQGPHGPPATLRCWLDSGGGSFIIGETTARALGYEIPAGKPDGTYVPIELPAIFVGDGPVRPFPGTLAYIRTGPSSEDRMGASQAFIPLGLFRYYACGIDYPNRTFALDPSEPAGAIRVPVSISKSLGFPRVDATVSGKTFGLLLDTGAACTMLSSSVVQAFLEANPRWRHVDGSYGAANMVGGTFDAGNVMLRIPELDVGACAFKDLVVVSRPAGVFETKMTQLTDGAVAGALAGNALRHFAIVVDFPASAVSFARTSDPTDTEWNLVPLCLTATAGGPVVARVADSADTDLKRSVLAGDVLTAVDGASTLNVPLQEVFEQLSGPAGSIRTLTIRRGDAVLTARAMVVRIV